MEKEAYWHALYTPMHVPHSTAADTPAFLQGGIPCSKLELSISARGLRDLDTFSKSDPQCIVHMKSRNGPYREIGRTEVIQDNLNPDFVKKIPVDFNFEEVQYLKFEFWDIDIGNNDFLGQCETTLPEIVANKNRQFSRPLTGPKKKLNYGNLLVVVEEVSSSKQIVTLGFHARDLRYRSVFCFSKPSSFLQFWRSNEDGSFTLTHKTPVCWSTRNPQYKPFEIKVRTLCNGDFDRNIRIEILQHKRSGDHKTIGRAYTTLNQLLSRETAEMDIKDNTNNDRGTLKLNEIKLQDSFSFFEYIKSGLEIHFAVAIDFTYSNGLIDNPSSLHYMDPANLRPNSYEIALRSVGEIIQYYNSTKFFAGFGFGGVLPGAQSVNHCFPLNGNIAHPYCEGVEQLLTAYRQIVRKVGFSGPTNFSPVIEYVASIASQNSNPKNYFVLLIITDGIICDMPQTIRSLIKSSSLPLSIIIVGVGDADFSAMDDLDSDDQLLALDGKKAVRDIVQFVPLNKYLRQGATYVQSQGDLAREVLYEIPEQVESFMRLRGLKPSQMPDSVQAMGTNRIPNFH